MHSGLDLEMEAVVQSQYVRSPDSFVKAEALGRLAGTGRAALPHVGSIVAALDGACRWICKMLSVNAPALSLSKNSGICLGKNRPRIG